MKCRRLLAWNVCTVLSLCGGIVRARVDVDVPVDGARAPARRALEVRVSGIDCMSINDVARAGVCGW